MIEIKNLSVRYGDFYALNHITLDIPRGTWTCLVGPNGAGKTTFLKTLLGNKAYDGSITIDGLEVYKNLRNVAFVPQRPEIPAGMDVAEYVMLGRARLDGWGRESRTSRRLVQQILEQMQLSAMRHQLVTQLSGGEMQRVLIARALVQEPELMILDEPTSGVDIFGRDLIRGIVRQLAGDGCAVIMATHELDEAQRVADHVLMFQDGNLLANAPLIELLDSAGEHQTLEDIFRSFANSSAIAKSRDTQ